MPITSRHPQYELQLTRWRTNRDAVAGQDAIHRAGELHLPDDNNSYNKDREAINRYKRYLARATWTPITSYTKEGLIGAVFRKSGVSELPEKIAYMNENVDGAGNSLEQFSKHVLGELLEVGRVGILTEYPRAEDGLSQAQVFELGLRPKLTTYKAEDIDNWRYKFVNGKLQLVMVKLVEQAEVTRDLFSSDLETRYRVLRIEEETGNYIQELYDEHENLLEQITPRQFNGNTWKYIPFQFVGASNNLPDVDVAPLSGIADLNIAHYQVTADKRKNLHIHSGGLLVISTNMSSEEFALANPNGVTVGADSGLFLGDSGSAQLLQLDASSQSHTEIESLERQLIAVGARLITKGGQAQTAEAARIDASAESSALSNVVGNASEGIEAALESACLFAGAEQDNVTYMLNMDFFDNKLNPQDVMALIQLGDRGLIAMRDQREMLRRSGLISHDRTDEEIDAEIDIQSVSGL
ncbi:MAG: DUF4055 domain-containing protein [Gammaproteobacteria bacterium]|nr:DUF4055 domain-containing protein [Gammaproteobacteria bacterium]